MATGLSATGLLSTGLLATGLLATRLNWQLGYWQLGYWQLGYWHRQSGCRLLSLGYWHLGYWHRYFFFVFSLFFLVFFFFPLVFFKYFKIVQRLTIIPLLKKCMSFDFTHDSKPALGGANELEMITQRRGRKKQGSVEG